MMKIFKNLKAKMENKVEIVVKEGGFIVTFRTYDMTIETLSKNFVAKFTASEHPYLYLYVAALQGNNEQVHGYCLYLYKVATTLTTEQGFVDDLTKIIKKHDRRMLKAAKEAAKKVTEEEDLLALKDVQRSTELSEMPDKEREEASKELVETYKETRDEETRN